MKEEEEERKDEEEPEGMKVEGAGEKMRTRCF